MEETTVVIVGAGPSGLALGALLGRQNVKVIILEKETEVCNDPRGIVVNGDAVRISYQIGIGEGLTKRIGKDIGVLNFHRGNFRVPPFMTFDITVDWAQQAVSNNVTQFQPNYEKEIRALLKEFPSCELREGCEVTGREETADNSVVEYIDQSGEKRLIRTTWLVGADGKRGVVRKRFLEPEGVRQVDSDWSYVGTWVAANLHVTLPTPKSHPNFPLWKLGYSPQQVHDIFWPSGFHFCNNSDRPQVSSRFGPAGSGFWRHEYSVEPKDNLDDVHEHFWNIFRPWMVLPGSQFSRTLKKTAIEFPRDCIELLRCRPFTFATKIVNKWFCRNTMLIGDAAHVFPPFGGQGIATGIRDAQGLSWRLAMMSKLSLTRGVQQKILTGWSQERAHGWKASMQATKLNGSIVNQRSIVVGLFWRMWMRVLWWFPRIAEARTRAAFRDKLVFNNTTCPDGFFLERAGGGRKVAQIWVRGVAEAPRLSDSALIRDLSRLSLVVLVRNAASVDPAEIARVLEAANLPENLLTMDEVTFYNVTGSGRDLDISLKFGGEIYSPCTVEELAEEGIKPITGYSSTAVQDRLPSSAKFVLLRPDFFMHSVASDVDGLSRNLEEVRSYFT